MMGVCAETVAAQRVSPLRETTRGFALEVLLPEGLIGVYVGGYVILPMLRLAAVHSVLRNQPGL